MRNGIKAILLVILAIGVFIAYSSVFIVNEREKALVIRLGEIQRTVTEPGLYFKTPIVEELVYVEDRLLFFESLDKSIQVIDGRRYNVDAIIMLKIIDAQKFRETANASLNQVRDRLETRLDSALRQTYGKRTFESALSKDRETMMTEIRDQVRGEALSLGVDIVDVRIRRTDLMTDVLKDTYDRMNAERFAEAAQLRAVGDTARRRIRAEAERESVEMVSRAKRESEIIRGQGEAKRNNIFANAFERDPEFFAFYRSMQAYPRSLKGDSTTLVLTPDSQFFRYLKDPLGGRKDKKTGQ
ncbi:MAG TPA: protease modulator HflC [Rhizobiales bacterium]|nr:modulator of FtsH protease HflC [bacterium BMS3Bbin10]HDO52876.1 protease modulator HflC [Hyphomicrobiales bacterium]